MCLFAINALAVESSSNQGSCGDGFCDDFEKSAGNCSQDCSNIPSNNKSTTTSSSTPTSVSKEMRNLIITNTINADVRNDIIIFGFTTQNVAISNIIVRKDGQAVKNLTVFSTSMMNPEKNGNENFPPQEFKTNHFYLVKGLNPNSQYTITVVASDSTQYFEKLVMNFDTSNSKQTKGTYKVETPVISSENETITNIDTFFSSGAINLDTIEQYCSEYGLAQEICTAAGNAKKEKGTNPNPLQSQGPKNTMSSIKETLADKFFNNKIIYYGDIGLLAILFILEIIYLFKSHTAWGVVFDSKERKPLQGVVVRVFSEENNKLLETKVTDKDGRYSFLVKPGNYYLDVIKEGYRFPSKFIIKRDDEFFTNMYRGEVIHIFKDNVLINPNISLDKIGETLESVEKANKILSNFSTKINYFIITKLRIILLILLTVLNVGFVIIAYVAPLLIIGILVGLMWLLEGYALFRKGYH